MGGDIPLSVLDKLQTSADCLKAAEAPMRVLRTIAWGPEVAERFFASGAREMPQVAYTPYEPRQTLEHIATARMLIDGEGPVQSFLKRTADALEITAHMLASVGTQAFHDRSVELFGAPHLPVLDGETRPLDLAHSLDAVLSEFSHGDLVSEKPPETLTAVDVRNEMAPRILSLFGEDAPSIQIVDNLSAKALAGTNTIKLRRNAPFSELDVIQLLQHEAYVHIATSLNGRAHASFSILGAGHPGTTRTQEGLAVFAELISGALDPARARRLADRAIAIKMAIDGADFIELYQFFLSRSDQEIEAFENARRVVRGGRVDGYAPFTKDGVYLEGLLRVHNFLRVAVKRGNAGVIRLLFAGKFDLEDLPAIVTLERAGFIYKPRFLPPWVRDMRFLVTYLAYSSFLNRVHLPSIEGHWAAKFEGL